MVGTYREALSKLSRWQRFKLRLYMVFIWCEGVIAPRRSTARAIRMVRGIRR